MFQESPRQAPADSLMSPTLTFGSAHPHPERGEEVCSETCALHHETSARPLPLPRQELISQLAFQHLKQSWRPQVQGDGPKQQPSALTGTHQAAPMPQWGGRAQLAPCHGPRGALHGPPAWGGCRNRSGTGRGTDAGTKHPRGHQRRTRGFRFLPSRRNQSAEG